MKIAVFGLGYVGTVSAACLARDGHEVIGVDINDLKVDSINRGEVTFSESHLEELVKAGVSCGRLSATTSAADAMKDAEVSLICVGTPSNTNGSLKLDCLRAVTGEIGEALGRREGYHVVCVRSTVLPGTVDNIVIPILQGKSGKMCGFDFGVCMNPEFLREGSAVEDYEQPCQIVMGQWDHQSGDTAMKMYEGIKALRVQTELATAEAVKYVSNTYHALKISFANEIGNICKSHGVDGQEVMEIFCNDDKLNISSSYLRPGYAFGGSCLPKDLRAIVYQANGNDVAVPVLEAVIESNKRQIERGIRLVENVGKQKVGVLGLSFKTGTDDVRESPVVPLVETLIGRGYDISIYDPYIEPEKLIGANKIFLERALPHVAKLMRKEISDVIKRIGSPGHHQWQS